MSTLEQNSVGAWYRFRRLLLKLHLWIGISLSIPFALLGVTGAFLVYDQDFDNVPRATAPGPFQPPMAIINAGVAAQPGGKAAGLNMPAYEGDPAIVRLARPGGGRGFGPQIYVDPASLQVLGRRDSLRSPLTDVMHGLHGSLSLGGATGRPLVGWLGVFMTFLGLSGLILWWPANGRFRKSIGVSKNAHGFVLYRQLHTTAGVVFWLVFVVVSFTGTAIAFPNTIGAGMHALFGGEAGPRNVRVTPVENQTPLDADAATALALSAARGTHLGSIFLPNEATQPYRIALVMDDAVAGAPTIAALVDPYKREVVSLRDPRNMALGDLVMGWQRTLHDGRALGPVWKALVAISGMLPPLFVVTGTLMWLSRRRARQAVRLRGREAIEGMPAE